MAAGKRPGRTGKWEAAAIGAVALWLSITAIAVWKHEPWFDEAQAWLLARDVSPWVLWTKLLHYEGAPGLWHGLLRAMIQLHVPYGGLGVLAACFGLAGAISLIWRSPFPWIFRILLPFTYYLIYQYSIVARSYVLMPVLLFAAAELYWHVREKPHLLTLVLCTLALVSAHGVIMSGVLFVATGLWRKRGDLLVYLCVITLAAATTWPASDSTSISAPNFEIKHMLAVTAISFREAFAGSWLLSGLIVALSLPFLWRGGAFLFFAVTTVSLGMFAAVVYGNVWHQGLLLLVWLTAMWIAGRKVRFPVESIVALSLMAGVQLYWSYASLRYDILQPYSGSKQAAGFLHRLPEGKIVALGSGCIALEPYFPANPFMNYHQPAYWDWSSANKMNSEGVALIAARVPEYVLISVKRSPDLEKSWSSTARRAGYVAEEHFPGALFWHSSILEPESFDLYRRVPASTATNDGTDTTLVPPGSRGL